MDFDSLPDDNATTQQAQIPVSTGNTAVPPQNTGAPAQGSTGVSFDDLTDDSAKYSTPKEQLKAGLEAAGRGFAGPLAPLAERIVGISKEDQLGRQQALEENHPVISGVANAAGLAAGLLTGTGEGALLNAAGDAAKVASGLTAPATLSARIGSKVVQQAAEMAVLQGSDEVSKRILQDPSATAESAIGNIGLAAAMGGVFGGLAGSAGELWKATLGPQAAESLNAIKSHFNQGQGTIIPEAVESAIKTVGVEPEPIVKSMLSDNGTARQFGSDLIRGEHKGTLDAIEKLRTDAHNSVVDSIGVPLEDIKSNSSNEAGHDIAETVSKEFKEKYEPTAKALDEKNAKAATIAIPDEKRLSWAGDLLEKGINSVGTDSPLYKYYQDYGQRLLAKDTVGGVDALRTEIGGEISKAVRAGDTNAQRALSEIRSTLGEKTELHIASDISAKTGNNVMGDAELAKRANANEMYSEFRDTMDTLTDHLGIGRASGYKGLLTKLTDKLSPEQLVNKFSPRGNADIIPFLQQHLPETMEKVRQNELKKILSSSISSKAGEDVLDLKKAAKAIENLKKTQPELVDFAIPKELQDKLAAARVLEQSLPDPKNSGTPAGLMRLLKYAPTGGMGGLGWILGHGPIGSGVDALIGHMIGKFTVEGPMAYKAMLLKLMSSDRGTSAEGFKAGVDYISKAYKAEKVLNKGVQAIFQTGGAAVANMPDAASREKLQKQLDNSEKTAGRSLQQNPGDLSHYFPEHQQSVTETQVRASQYLQTLKPHPYRSGPLDREIQPAPAEIARYNRAMDIAQNPNVVLQHIKDGTLLASDIKDINSMYPSLAQTMIQKISNEMNVQSHNEDHIPYRTRISMSLFLGQPLDTSMHPASIIAAQPQPKQPPQAQGNGKVQKNTAKLGDKTNALYKTAAQEAESDRSSRD